jgi:integral membrane protein
VKKVLPCAGLAYIAHMTHRSLIGWLRWTGLVEGVSFLVLLFVAMPLKHLYGQPQAVRIVGMAHGVLFLGYVLLLLRVWALHQWPIMRVAGFFGAGLVPFGPFIADRRLRELDGAGTPN